MEVIGQLHASAALSWGERAPGTHSIGVQFELCFRFEKWCSNPLDLSRGVEYDRVVLFACFIFETTESISSKLHIGSVRNKFSGEFNFIRMNWVFMKRIHTFRSGSGSHLIVFLFFFYVCNVGYLRSLFSQSVKIGVIYPLLCVLFPVSADQRAGIAQLV
jgi:hypothetical protein